MDDPIHETVSLPGDKEFEAKAHLNAAMLPLVHADKNEEQGTMQQSSLQSAAEALPRDIQNSAP
jgi:hypothetical protein